MKDITSLIATVHYAIGKASMCWSVMPQGDYDEAKANEIANDLIAAIRETMMEAGLSNALDDKPNARKNKRHIAMPAD